MHLHSKQALVLIYYLQNQHAVTLILPSASGETEN